MNANFLDRGKPLDQREALSAISANAMLSSNIEAPLTATEGGRKCLSHSGMWSTSHALARQYVSGADALVELLAFLQSTGRPASVQLAVVAPPSASGAKVHLQLAI